MTALHAVNSVAYAVYQPLTAALNTSGSFPFFLDKYLGHQTSVIVTDATLDSEYQN